MQLTKKKIKSIENVLVKLSEYAKLSTFDSDLIQKALNKIIQIHNDKQDRSLPEHRLYWVQCDFIARHLPENILNMLGIKYATETMIHEMLKAHSDITSTAFNNMEQGEFNDYHKKSIEWVATYIFRMDSDTFQNWFEEEK